MPVMHCRFCDTCNDDLPRETVRRIHHESKLGSRIPVMFSGKGFFLASDTPTSTMYLIDKILIRR